MVDLHFPTPEGFDPTALPERWQQYITVGSGEVTFSVFATDDSYRYRALMEFAALTLKFVLPFYFEFPLGTTCTYQGETYTLNVPQNIKKQGTANIEYTLTLGQGAERMGDLKARNSVDGRLKWTLTAKPHEFIDEIVAELNQRDGEGVWSRGECIDAAEKTVEFNHTYIADALQDIADTFGTEWEVSGHEIRLRKVEYYKDDPLPLSYGRGNGFVPGVGRTTLSSDLPVKRMYAEGGESNIDRSKYGGKNADGTWKNAFHYSESSATLRLPISQSIEYEGRTYTSDSEGLYIERTDKASAAVREDSLDCTEIYPSRVGTISAVAVVSEESNFYDITDSSIPEALDYSACLISGETATIIFQSGQLAGREFEFIYHHSDRRFEIVPQELDGQVMPGGDFLPAVGDTYAVFGIMLPDAYICDDASKSGASWDMMQATAKALYEAEEQKFTFTGTLDGIWAARDWENIGARLIVGGYIRFSDTQFAAEGTDIRITGIKDYLNRPHSPEIEISNSAGGRSVTSQLRSIDNTELLIDSARRSIMGYTRRRFRDAQETMQMLQEAINGYSAAITPITVSTMQMLVGDESLQFRFVTDPIEGSTVQLAVTYNSEAKQLKVNEDGSAAYLQHLTLGVSSISSSRDEAAYLYWAMPAYTSAVLDDADARYYLYAKVDVNGAGSEGEWLLSQSAIGLNDVAGYYHLLVGILNSEAEGLRSFATLYGYTEILPGRITTDSVVSGDGESWFNLADNSFKLGDNLSFADGQLSLKGALVQSGSGATAVLGCWRGAWSSASVYFVGDEVSYTASGLTSTYRCIQQATAGIVPTNTTYWVVVAAGSKGDSGTSITAVAIVYGPSDSTTTEPTSWANDFNKVLDSGAYLWQATQTTYSDGTTTLSGELCLGRCTDFGDIATEYSLGDEYVSSGDWQEGSYEPTQGMYLWQRTRVTYVLLQVVQYLPSEEGQCISYFAADGKDGATGSSPAMVYRGEWYEGATYYGSAERRDVVLYSGVYYIMRTSAGQRTGVLPTDTTYWAQFGASLESVATGLLLAENANVGGLIFRNNRLESQPATDGVPNFYIDGSTGEAQFAQGKVVLGSNYARFGWLQAVYNEDTGLNELIGYDTSGVERIRITPDTLPTNMSSGSQSELAINGHGATSAGTTDNSLAWPDFQLDAYSDGTIQRTTLIGWVTFALTDAGTLKFSGESIDKTATDNLTGEAIDADLIEAGCSVSITDASGTEVASSEIPQGTTLINLASSGTYTATFTADIAVPSVESWAGMLRLVITKIMTTATINGTIIAQNGFLVKFGTQALRLNEDGLMRSTNGGTTWTEI